MKGVQQDDLRVLGNRLQRDRGRAGDIAQDDLDLALGDHPSCRRDGFDRRALAVATQQFDRSAVDAAGGIDLRHGKLGTVQGKAAEACRRAAQRDHEANAQCAALAGILGERSPSQRGEGDGGGGERGELAACQHRHATSPSVEPATSRIRANQPALCCSTNGRSPLIEAQRRMRAAAIEGIYRWIGRGAG